MEDVVRRLKVCLEAAYTDGTRLPHMLFVGAAGTGKTLVANLSAKEMGVQLHERIAQVMNYPAALNGLLLQAQDKEVVLLDEIHELLPSAQTILYRAMEGQQISLRTNGDNTLNMPLNDITVIGCTTDEYRLLSPLRQRFKVVIPFSHYDDTSLGKIILQRARLEGIDIQPEIGLEIAKRSRGTPRLAIRLFESCHRYARSIGESTVTLGHFEETVVLDGIDELGLAADDQ
ncbi:MAG: AAA family ATPase, partial [Planctomycetes bacterium]|nr:AAA family ATPase [Planctomycetota bacterium]